MEVREKIGTEDKDKVEVKSTSNPIKKKKETAGSNFGQNNEEITTAASKDEVSSLKSGEKKASLNSIGDSKDANTEKGTLTAGEGAAGVTMMNVSKSLNNLNTVLSRGNDNA